MIYLGQSQDLEVMRLVAVGAFLGDETGEVLLPYKYVPTGLSVGDSLRVFVHTDSEDRLVAVTRMPSATLGNVAVMEVVDQTSHGVFVDWGLEKDLFVPEIEQHHAMRVGSRYVVEVRSDERTDRLIGSTRLGRFFDPKIDYMRPRREVELLVWSFNDVGAQVVVDGRHSGLIYSEQVPRNLKVGDALQGYVVRLREGGKIDISLRKLGMAAGLDAQAMVLEALGARGDGFLPLHDKSSPADIAQHFDLSKRVFKAAIGGLFKRERIELLSDGIRLRRDT